MLVLVLMTPAWQGMAGDSPNANAPGEADALIEASLHRLREAPWLRADLRYHVQPSGQTSLTGRGLFEERQADGDRLTRLELAFPLGRDAFRLLQIRDGRFLWTIRDLAEGDELSRIDLDRVAAARAEQDANLPPPSAIDTSALSTGGVTGLIEMLRATYESIRAQPGMLHHDGGRTKVWRIDGRMRAAVRQRLGLPMESDATSAANLPPMLPDRVTLMLDHETRLPLRIEFRQSTNPSETRLLAAVELNDLTLGHDASGAPGQDRFHVEPGPRPVTDETPRHLGKPEAAEKPP
jgi:hypothetical protein